MELFLPRRPGCFVYNDYLPDEDRLVARVHESGVGEAAGYDRPLYCISPDGRHGASLSFARIPRRGYSYADALLPEGGTPPDLDAEGIFVVDLDSGESRLAVSYRQMLERHPTAYALDGRYLWLNHIIFNCDGTRLLWLLRHCADPRHIVGAGWQTYMYTSSLEGSDVECILPEVYWQNRISHQIWGRAPREILVDADWTGNGHEAVVFDESRRPFLARSLSPGHGRMAHLVFSPDGRHILADSYPDSERRQRLCLLDADSGQVTELGVFRHETAKDAPVDVRCDLHPRWSPDGRVATVDSIHDGRRAIYALRLDGI